MGPLAVDACGTLPGVSPILEGNTIPISFRTPRGAKFAVQTHAQPMGVSGDHSL